MKNIIATKKELNKVIRWSSSRYNELKKKDVVNQIIFLLEIGEETKRTFGTGSYSERGHLGGWDYILEIKQGIATLTEQSNVSVTYLIEKAKKNRLYTGAKEITVQEAAFDWHKPFIGHTFQVDSESPESFCIEVEIEQQKRMMVIKKSLVRIES